MPPPTMELRIHIACITGTMKRAENLPGEGWVLVMDRVRVRGMCFQKPTTVHQYNKYTQITSSVGCT